MYPVIDMKRTGRKLKIMLSKAGYNVKFLQEYLHLSCPQSIYRWFKGKTLPSIDNLYALSSLLGVHMEDLIVLQNQSIVSKINLANINSGEKRILYYYKHICKVA